MVKRNKTKDKQAHCPTKNKTFCIGILYKQWSTKHHIEN